MLLWTCVHSDDEKNGERWLGCGHTQREEEESRTFFFFFFFFSSLMLLLFF
jgi:hypothetical protein